MIIGTLSLLSEGIDLPHLGALIFATPVSAEVERDHPAATRLIQSIGRCRRPYPNKRKAFVLDIIDNHPLGLATFKKRQAIYQQQAFEVNCVQHEIRVSKGKPRRRGLEGRIIKRLCNKQK